MKLAAYTYDITRALILIAFVILFTSGMYGTNQPSVEHTDQLIVSRP